MAKHIVMDGEDANNNYIAGSDRVKQHNELTQLIQETEEHVILLGSNVTKLKYVNR